MAREARRRILYDLSSVISVASVVQSKSLT
jgi:hypothetical protein